MRVRRALVAAAVAAGITGGAAVAQQDTVRADTTARRTASGPFSLVVDLSDRELHVLEGEDVVKSYRVAIGTEQHPTPRGEFRIRRIIWNPRWVPPDAAWARNRRPREAGDPRNPMGRVKMFFQAPDYYIHGTHEEDSLGQAESHGCLRMRNADVIELARTVMENGGERRDPNWFTQVINRVRSTRDVRLSQPVLVRIRE